MTHFLVSAFTRSRRAPSALRTSANAGDCQKGLQAKRLWHVSSPRRLEALFASPSLLIAIGMNDLARVLLLPFFLHSCATGMRFTATLDALSRQADAFAVGTMLATVSILPAFFAIASGRWIDRKGAAGAVFASMLAAMLSGLAALFPGFSNVAQETSVFSGMGQFLPLLPLFAACPLAGLSFMLINTSTQRLVGDVSSAASRRMAFTALSLVTASSNLLTPVVAGYVIEFLGFRAVYLWCILAPLVLWAVFHLPTMRQVLDRGRRSANLGSQTVVPTHKGSNATAKTSAPAQSARKVRKAQKAWTMDLLADAPLRAVIIASVLVSVTWEVSNLLTPLHAAACGLSPAEIGWVLGSFAAATFVVRFLMPLLMRRLGEWQLITLAFVTAGVALLGLAFCSSLPGLIVAAFVLGLGLGASLPNMMTLVYLFAPANRIGEAIGLRIMLINIGRATFPVLAGAAGAIVGAGASLVGLALLAFGGWGFALRSRDAVKKRLDERDNDG